MMTSRRTAGQVTISRRSALAVTVATVVAATSGYLILVVAARTLGPVDYGRFSVFWALYFGVLGILFGVQQEATRAVSADATAPKPGSSFKAVRVVPISFAIGGAFAGLLGATAVAWAPRVFPAETASLATIVVVASILYAGQTGMLGSLSGSRQWSAFAAILTVEALVRLAAVLAAAAWGFGVGGLALATATAASAWLAVTAANPSARQAWHARGDVSARSFVKRTCSTMLAATASATLVVGFPVLLQVTTPGGLGSTGGALVLAITLTRAPLLVPLNALQGVAISHFVSHRATGVRVLVQPALVLATIGMAGATAAWLLGRPIMVAAFGPGFAVDPGVLAALIGGATLIAALTLTGSAVVAFERHRAFAAGWVLASAVSIGVLLTNLPLTERAVLSLTIGPLAGVAVHVTTLTRRRSRR